MNSIIISHNIWHIVLVITFSLQLCCPLTCLALQGCHPVLNKAQQLWTFSSYSQPLYSYSWVLNWTHSFTLFFKSPADLAFHQSWDVTPSCQNSFAVLSMNLWLNISVLSLQLFDISPSARVYLPSFICTVTNLTVSILEYSPCTVGGEWSSLL